MLSMNNFVGWELILSYLNIILKIVRFLSKIIIHAKYFNVYYKNYAENGIYICVI